MKHLLYIIGLLLFSTTAFAQKKDVLWVKKLPKNTLPIQMTHDAAGNIYIAGTMWETCTFDNITITSVGGNDVFVVKYDRDGNQLWVKNTGGINREESGGMVVDHSGNVYICGYFRSNNDTSSIFGPQVVSRGEEDIFVAKLDANGNAEWVKTAGSKYEDKFFTASMAIDANDNIYISGRIVDTAYCGNIIIVSPHGLDAFVLSYDKNGNERWGQALGGSFKYPFGRAVTIDNSGNVYATGTIGDYDSMYIVKYNVQGTMLWLKTFGDPNCSIQSYDITAAPNGNIYIAGGMDGTVTFGNKTLANNISGFQSFVLACDNAGNALWADTVGAYSEYPTHIAADAYSNAYIGSEPAIYTRYDEAGNRLWQEQEPATHATYTFDEDGYMYVTGETARLGSQSYLPDTANFLVKFAQFPTNVATAKPAIQVSVYPNPATHMLTITAVGKGTYHITALSGTTYLSGNISKEKSVDINALPTGIYVLQYEAGIETAYAMFEKQ
jgi:hypothetical protein